MREILGRRRKSGPTMLDAAMAYATRWTWQVVPGVGLDPRSPGGRDCACGRPDCPVPGAHPHDPGLLGATDDARMVRWWWTRRPDAPIVLATGSRVSAVSLPAVAGARALETLRASGTRIGPVLTTPTRCSLLVAPYALAELGELLDRHDWVPTSLRYHGQGGFVVLPPSRPGAPGPEPAAHWVRAPVQQAPDGLPWLPQIAEVVDALVEAGRTAPDGRRLRY
jgi:hypothetical protein